MKLKPYLMLALLWAIAQGVWAQTSVKSEQELKDAITDGATNIQLTANILLENYLDIDGKTVTIDLNGHKLYRSLSVHGSQGHVIWAHNGSNLTLTSSVAGGSIEGGMANNGGAIHIPFGNTVSATNVTFRDNSAGDHAGAIWNNGTFTATNCTFTNNNAKDVGGIYNSVTTDGAGTATLTNCTFTLNRGIAGAGALANALGATVMNIEDCTIENNTAYEYGAGIWNGGTLNMKGAVKVTGNKNEDNAVSNLYLKFGNVITLTGALTGSNIGVDLESVSGPFTSGYNTYHNGVDPSTFFGIDHLSGMSMGLDDKGEVCLFANHSFNYIERSWDATNKQVVSTEKSLTGTMIGYEATPTFEGQYKEVTKAPADSPNQWFGMGGYSTSFAEFYVVREDVNRETIVVQGSNVHLILCDGVTLTLTGGLKLEGNNKLYIHCQSYGDNMGRLMVTNSYKNGAGIGSAWHNDDAVKVGELVIYGGHIEASGGKFGAGIGSCGKSRNVGNNLCNRVTVYGGYVKATGGTSGAGIGGGSEINGGTLIVYSGSITADGGEDGAGIGGGYTGNGGNVTVYGGSITVNGGYSTDKGAAGIGGGSDGNGGNLTVYGGSITANGGFSPDTGAAGIGGGYTGKGGNVTVYGGSITAIGGIGGAGIGGGSFLDTDNRNNKLLGGQVKIYGGTVTAKGGPSGAGIGGGDTTGGGQVNISGGLVTATGGSNAAGIGGGKEGRGGEVTITGGTVKAKAGSQDGTGKRAIGGGYLSSVMGTLTIGDAMMVGAGENGTVERIVDANERKKACWYRSYAELSLCTHPSGITYTINEDDSHTSHCKHCGVSEKGDHFNSDGTGTCVCGYEDGGGDYHTITVATSSNGKSYEGVGVMAKVGNNMPYTLPVCSSIPEGYDFAGWAVNPVIHNGILPYGDETLLQAGENIIVNAPISIFARYKALAISLADDSDNGEMLYNYNGRKAASVTLTDRTLWKDGKWNTLCLPFEVSATSEPLSGEGVVAMTLNTQTSGFSDGTLTLNFTNVNGATIPAGTPFIIKWPNDDNNPTIDDPTFTGVTLSNELIDATCTFDDEMSITFKGTYQPVSFDEEGDNTVLYLGADNTLYYPSGAMTINAQRAFFQLDGLTASEGTGKNGIKAFELNFGEEETGIRLTEDGRRKMDDGWYSIDGRRIIGMPAAKGVYISGDKKVMIK